jgi:phosphoribosylformylglycinamidine (FGAM) synthase-like enzyme
MIKNTHQLQPKGTVVAYSDNSSIMEGAEVSRFFRRQQRIRGIDRADAHLMKVETHNHPTAISHSRAPRPAPAAKSATKARPAAAPSRRRA